MSDLAAIFKAYDVRGRIDNGELSNEVARRIGAALAVYADVDRVAVGWDCRASSPGLAHAFMTGLAGQGVDVLDLGEVATDMVYFVSGAMSCPGAMITASHNPPEWNGIKMCLSGAAPIGEETGLVQIRALAQDSPALADRPGSITPYQAAEPYIDHLLALIDPSSLNEMTVAVDGGNGMAGVVLPQIFDRIKPRLLGLYLEPDGTFPNHPANPIEPENLVDLLEFMERNQPDLGVAFDGDADRAFFVDELGQPLSGSATTALIARWFLAREPGASIVHNLITSRAVPELVIRHGGHPIRTRVGHSFIKAVMAESGAIFGGEHSGHYYFRDNFRADSGMLAMLVLMQVISESGKTLSELRADVDPYFSSGEVNVRVNDAALAMEAVARGFDDAEVDRLDGLTLTWNDRWVNVRPSNTEPFLRINVEAEVRESMLSLTQQVQAIIKGAG